MSDTTQTPEPTPTQESSVVGTPIEASAGTAAPFEPTQPVQPTAPYATPMQPGGQSIQTLPTHPVGYQPQPGFPGMQPMVQVAPKSPGLALLASFFFPGLGSLLNGEVGKGVGIFAGYVASWIFCFILIGIPFLFGFWIWGLVDAYQGAKKWNAKHGIIS